VRCTQRASCEDMLARKCLCGHAHKEVLVKIAHKEVLVKEVLVRRCLQGGACEDMFTRC
jgi:hypothetical protein